ncbi:hypothetical protein BC826DRAFT_903641 [Russula brevipes]|nr:hypothetical protein BC826DRAFT_903641 [Russula brevipes]
MFELVVVVISIIAAALPLHALQLHHRVLHPSFPQPSFLPRASILSDAAGNLRIEPPPASTSTDFAPFAETAHVTGALYQLALDPQPGIPTHSGSFPLSRQSCHLVDTANEHIVLHLPYPGGTPFALEYFLDSVPSDGTCPPSKASGPTLALPQNVTVAISLPTRPPLPELRVPPPLSATGDPVVQAPEKTFLQKYWLYIVIALGALSAFLQLLAFSRPSLISFLR